MTKSVAAVLVLAALAAAGILANHAVARDQDYRRLIVQGDDVLSRGQTFAAIEAYSGAIALKPDSMLGYLKRGEAHRLRGDTEEILSASLRDLRAASALDPGATRALEKLGDVNFDLKRFANAADDYQAYLRLDDHAPTIHYKLALALRADGHLTRAVSALQHALARNATFVEAHYVLGLCLKDREQLSEARDAFNRALSISPAFIPAREELAEVHRLDGRPRDEIEQLDALYALDARAERLIEVGMAYLRAGRRDLALNTLRKAVDRFPDHASVYAALGQIWLRAADDSGDPADVRRALEALAPISTQPDTNSETLGLYGRALVLAGEYTRAETVLQDAAQRLPTDPDVLPLYASVAQTLGHIEDARDALVRYSALIDDDREKAIHAVRIADLSMRLDDPWMAVQWYEKSVALHDSTASVQARLAAARAILATSTPPSEPVSTQAR